MNYQEVLDYMEEAKSYGIVPGLSNITALCEYLGDPQESLKFIHIAGTNGKGSTLSYLTTVLKEAGYKVGSYLSPVLFTYQEKFQIGGRPITQKDLGRLMEEVKDACDRMVAEGLPHPTPFEIETALGFLYFAEKKCDLVVLECGMGGALDATNVIHNTVACVFSSISMDHMQYLGNTLEKIATEKAGIIKKGCVVVSTLQKDEVMAVILKRANELGCAMYLSDASLATKVKYGYEKQSFYIPPYGKIEIALAGHYQIENACLALRVFQALNENGYTISDKAVLMGMRKTLWPGRFQVIAKKPLFIVDGAHNEDASIKLANTIRFYFTNKRIIFIMGILRDKEYEKIIRNTVSLASQIITVQTPMNPRAMSAIDLAKEIGEYHPSVTAASSLEEAVEMAYLLASKEDVIISFGSLSYLGQMISIVQNRTQMGRKK